MAAPQGIASFPGIEQVIDASITRTHGISPSVTTLTIAPQPGLVAQIGTLRLEFDGTVIELPDCRIDYSKFEGGAGARRWRLGILDRRWKWKFGQISGSYNRRRADGSLQNGQDGSLDSERSPQELAELCLEAMGETDFDVSDLPDDARPPVEWVYKLPAEALASLCGKLGCRVVLQLDNRVVIRRIGVGATLSEFESLDQDKMVNPPERPRKVAVVCGPSRFQVDFQLEAVGIEPPSGLEQAEILVELDKLTYKPSSGWSRSDLPYFHQVDADRRALAQKSVFKYYRIKTPIEVPGYDGPRGTRVSQLEQILPLDDAQVKTVEEDGELHSREPVVFGVWYPDRGGVQNCTTSLAPLDTAKLDTDRSIYDRPFQIDHEKGLVIFEEPVYANTHASATGGAGYEVVAGPAQLVLRAACQVRDADTSALERHVRERDVAGGLGDTTRFERHDDLVVTHVPTYSSSFVATDVSTNENEIAAELDKYLDALERDYVDKNPQHVRYAGLVPIELDGAIQEISFHLDAKGTTTKISRDMEMPRGGFGHEDRRRAERLRDAELQSSMLERIARAMDNLGTSTRKVAL
jgi:hypothetical protein